jgi:hypothetical protein
METLTLDSAKPFSLELIKHAILQNWHVKVSNGDTLIVHGSESRAYLHVDVTSNSPGQHRLLLDYSDVELAKSLVERIADVSDLIVDNDFGTVLPGNQFVARIKAERGWNWRK